MRVTIIQDIDELTDLYAHRLDYDLGSPGFAKYVTERTGICESHKWVDCDGEPVHQHQFITQLKIQDCWEIWNQPGYKPIYYMAKLIQDGINNC